MRVLARALLALLLLSPLACSAASDQAAFEEGKQYKKVPSPQEPIDPKRIEVTEIFWYGCPHCYHFDPVIDGWRSKAPADVVFDRVPATLGHATGEMHARAFYIAEALGVGEKIHKPLFNAIHEDHQPLSTLDALRDFFGKVAGVKPADFDQASSSFMVDSRLRRAESLVRAYGITGVPTIIVDGRYSTGIAQAGGPDKILEVIDFLVEKSRKERKLK